MLLFPRFIASITATLIFLANAPLTHAGALLFNYYGTSYPAGGNALTNLTVGDPNFPSFPDFAYAVTTGLQDAPGQTGSFGTWARGFLEAPQTGSYTFWIASDDDGQFSLSTDATIANLVPICTNSGAVGEFQYTVTSAQQSAPISLVAGQKYYFEMLHSQGVGGEHCEVSWRLPDGSSETLISSNHLWVVPVDPNTTGPLQPMAPAILSFYQGSPVPGLDPTTVVVQGRPLDLSVTIEASQPAYVQWYSNNIPIAGANLAYYHFDSLPLSADTSVFTVIVTNTLGAATNSTTISITPDTTPPTLVDAFNLGNPAGDIAVAFSENLNPATATNSSNYSIDNGASISSATMSNNRSAVLLRVTGLTIGTRYTITVNNVQDVANNSIAPNSTIAVEQNLHTWFRMDETAAPTTADFSGNGRNATMANGVSPGYAGQVLRALKFDGAGGHLQCQNSANDFSTNGMTVALWANPTSSLTTWARFIDYANGAASDNILFARAGVSADLTFEVYNGGVSGGKVTATGVINLNQWQHFVATMDAGGNVTLYKNGVPVATGTTANPNPINRISNFAGRSNWATDGYYQGKMDDIRIYTRVLDPAAVAALAAGGGPDDSSPSIPPVSVVATVPTTALKSTPPGVFTITRNGSTNSALTVNYSLAGTATNGISYTNLSGSVTIPAGTNSASIFVKPIDFAFTGVQQTVVLAISPNAGYTIADADSATVTIQNNDVVPSAILATADNSNGIVPTTVDVWFGATVTLPSATNLANYTLVNAPGLTITNAVLSTNSNLRVVLSISDVVPSGAQISVTGVQDQGGNSGSAQVAIWNGLTPANVVANCYHGTTGNRATAFGYVSDGVANNTNNSPTGGNTGFDTFGGLAVSGSFNATLTQFGGMIYSSPQQFESVKVDLGRQFGDGGDWQAQPILYILKNPIDRNNFHPEACSNDWIAVPAQLISGSTRFQAAGWPNQTPSPNTPYVFSLTGLTAAQRTGWGWAVGGAKGNGANGFLSFSELRAYGVTGTSALHPPPNVVAASIDTINSLIDVWFDQLLDGNSAQNLGNFTFNDPALSINFVTTNANGMAATISFSGTPTTNNLTVTAANIQGLITPVMPGPQTVAILPENWPVANVVANAYQQNRATVCLPDSTNGVVVHAAGDANVWQTFDAPINANTSDFAGLIYPQPQAFGLIKVDLGHQFGDGGDWELQPSVYILTNNIDTSTSRPETNPNWVRVPATLISDNVFTLDIDSPVNTDPPPNSTIAFDLSHLPLTQRFGYGWAVGGTPGNQAAHFLSISELRAFGTSFAALTNISGPPQVLLDVSPAAPTAVAGLPISFIVYATGSQPLSYQWKFNGVNLNDNGRIIGSHSNMLTIAEVFTNDIGNYQLFITNSSGFASSSPATLSVVNRILLANTATWSQNGNAGIVGNGVTLTAGATGQDSSSFLKYPVYIGAFAASWTYQDVGGGGADGVVFVAQNSSQGPTALGGGGSALGYGGIFPSVGLEFNIYGPNTPGIAFRANGATGAPYDPTTPVNVASGDPIDATLFYDGTTLSLTLTDSVAAASFTTNFPADLPTVLGTNAAYVGFTGASGGVASRQMVTNFFFSSLPKLTFQPTGTNTFIFNWPELVGGFQLQQNTNLNGGTWVSVPNPVSLVNGQNQIILPPSPVNHFYRLTLP